MAKFNWMKTGEVAVGVAIGNIASNVVVTQLSKTKALGSYVSANPKPKPQPAT